MLSEAYVGIDNGTTGSIGVLVETSRVLTSHMLIMPTLMEQSYTKAKKNISRINWRTLVSLLADILPGIHRLEVKTRVHVVLERPMVNPGRFNSTTSALRALEATLIALEILRLSKQYVDSKEWQKVMLPNGIKGGPELKKASMDIGRRLYPQHAAIIKKHKDADGLLMATWARRERR